MSRFNLYITRNVLTPGMDPSVYDPSGKQSQILVETDVLDTLMVPSSVRPVSANQVIGLDDRLGVLEGNLYEYEIYESISSGTTGVVSLPEGADIQFGQYPEGQDCIITETDTQGKPIDDIARTSAGVIIIGTISEAGVYTLSAQPRKYPVALIYQVVVSAEEINNIPFSIILNQSRIQLYTGIIGGASVTQVR